MSRYDRHKLRIRQLLLLGLTVAVVVNSLMCNGLVAIGLKRYFLDTIPTELSQCCTDSLSTFTEF
jgi:hypothetical protein